VEIKPNKTELNAEPDNDDQFIVYKGMDSCGYDIRFYGGKTVDELKPDSRITIMTVLLLFH